MDIKLNGKKAKYIELYEEIAKLINNGTLKPLEKLPSKRNLSIDLNLSLNTVINAYDLLLDEGYIYSIEKSGYYVSDQISINVKPKIISKAKKINTEYIYDFTTKNIQEFNSTNYKKIIRSLINDNEFLNKTEFQGDLGLREAISSHLKENRGISTSVESIFIGSGIESLRSVLRIVNIDNITFENPGYHKLEPIASNLGLKTNYLELDSDGILIPTYKTIIYSTTFNQFPTGIKMSIKRKKELSDFLNRTGSYLIEDDFDAEFRIKESPSTPIYSLSNNVIFFSSFTMTMYPGLRISFFILPDSLREKYLEHYRGYSSSITTLEQLALRDFINQGYYASHINKLKKKYLLKRNMIKNLLDKNNISYDDKKNYLSILVDTKKDANIISKNLREKGVNVSTISDYDINKKNYNTLIIGYTSISEDLIEKGMNEIIKEIKG